MRRNEWIKVVVAVRLKGGQLREEVEEAKKR